MANRGVSPIDATSDVGKLRYTVGDTAGIDLDPVQIGFLDYAYWSDDALEAALSNSGGNILRSAGNLFLQLAVESVLSGRSVRTDDLAIDTRTRGKDLRDIAQSYFDEAASADVSASNDFFQIIPFSGRTGASCKPEGSAWPTSCYGCENC